MPDVDTARQQVQASGYDGILVSTMRGVTERTTVDPGVAYASPFWTTYYGPRWGSTWDPAYVDTDTFVKFETTLWDPRGSGTMIWSDVTQTTNPSSTNDFTKSLTKSVIPAMERAGLLPAAAPGAPISRAALPGMSQPEQASGR
jgi:hypothetical protein